MSRKEAPLAVLKGHSMEVHGAVNQKALIPCQSSPYRNAWAGLLGGLGVGTTEMPMRISMPQHPATLKPPNLRLVLPTKP